MEHVHELLEGVPARLAGLDLKQVEQLVATGGHEIVEAQKDPPALARLVSAHRAWASRARPTASSTSSGVHFGTVPRSPARVGDLDLDPLALPLRRRDPASELGDAARRDALRTRRSRPLRLGRGHRHQATSSRSCAWKRTV
jgi:hypothetical protein